MGRIQPLDQTDQTDRTLTAPSRRLILRTDGASRGNPGQAAAGVVIEDAGAEGALVAQGKLYLGVLTNNQAEYRALILGLKTVKQYNPTTVSVYMDSDLLVQQMNGTYKVRNAELASLYAEARALADELPNVTFTHVRRGLNAKADRLANEALDEHSRNTSRARS